MEFSRQEYCSGLPFPLPDPGIKPRSPALQADYLLSEPPAHQTQIEMKYLLSHFSLNGTKQVIHNTLSIHISFLYVGVGKGIYIIYIHFFPFGATQRREIKRRIIFLGNVAFSAVSLTELITLLVDIRLMYYLLIIPVFVILLIRENYFGAHLLLYYILTRFEL